MAFFCKSYENVLIWVFLHAEFISALKTIFSESLKQKCLIPTESCFLDGNKPNIAKLVDINFLADNEKNRQAIGFAKMEV